MTVQTPQNLRRLERESGVEFVHGRVVEKPVSIESSEIEGTIFAVLWNHASKTRSARVFPSSMGYQCFADEPDKFRKPDVSVIRSDRTASIDPNDGFMPIPADLVVEVVSPNDLSYDITEKVEEYLRNGFGLVWVVHPNTRTIAVHRADRSVTVLHENDEITGESALPEFRCKISEFFVTLV